MFESTRRMKLDMERIFGRQNNDAYVDSWRKRLTLCMVISAVGEDEMMMMGWKLPVIRGQ